MFEGVRVPVGPTVVGVVLAVLVAASTSGVVGPLDSVVNSTRTVTSDALGAVGVDVESGGAGSRPDTLNETASRPDTLDETAIERAIQRQVNDERATATRLSVDRSASLRRIARLHRADMARNGYVAHESPAGNTTADRYDRFEHDCESPPGEDTPQIGETLARVTLEGTATNETGIATRVVQGWMDSESHRQTLLASDWERTAVGVAVTNRTGDRVAYVTQSFC